MYVRHSINVENNPFWIANHAWFEQYDNRAIAFTGDARDFELLMREVGNLQDCSTQIRQNWLATYKTKYLGYEDLQQYKRIVILLTDIDKLAEKVKTTIQCAQLRKIEILEAVCVIVSDCLQVELGKVIFAANFASDLGATSSSWNELLLTMEKRFSIKINNEKARELLTVQQLIDYILLLV